MEVLLVLKLNLKTYYLECTNVANKHCVKFCMKENFRCMEGMSNEMKNGLKLKLGDATRVTPRNIQEVQASNLGDAQGIPFFINKNPRFLPNTFFIVSCTFVLFLERLIFHFRFVFLF